MKEKELELLRQLMNEQPAPPPKETPKKKVYRVWDKLPDSVRRRLQNAEQDEKLRSWCDAVHAMPKKTKGIAPPDREFIARARSIWKNNVCGMEDVFQELLNHAVEYTQTGHTTGILLVGPPGTGKTMTARLYGEFFELPVAFVSAPSASRSRGLAGDPSLYVGAGCGAIAGAMLAHGIGNPVLAIDEIDKAAGSYSGRVSFVDELLSVLDDSASHWYENYLEFYLDISHCPVIMTANSRDAIPGPILDRVDVIEVSELQKEELCRMVQQFTVPRALEKYRCTDGQIELAAGEQELLVDLLWAKGKHSGRIYNKAVEKLVSRAFQQCIENEQPVRITQEEVRTVADGMAGAARRLGF